MTSLVDSTLQIDAIPYWIIATSSKGPNDHLDKLLRITLDFLAEKKVNYKTDPNELAYKSSGTTSWKVKVINLTTALEVGALLMQHHNYLYQRQKGVEVYLQPSTINIDMQKDIMKIGERPPTPNNLETFEDVYFEQYLPDHSLPMTRWIHALATIAGVSGAVYGIFSANWHYIPAGIGFIYASGFLSHLFVEKNTPSSGKYPLQSIYSDLRVTFQTLLNPFTGGMDRDLAVAGIYNVNKIKTE
jgi:hypothetical protein